MYSISAYFFGGGGARLFVFSWLGHYDPAVASPTFYASAPIGGRH